MAKLTFEEDKAATQSSYKVVKKGAQVLTLTALEEGTSASGKAYLEATLHSAKDEADFKQKFFLTQPALPKLKDLIKGLTGTAPTEIDTDELPAMLIGQSCNFVVDAQIVSKEKDGKVYNNEYPAILRFRDFANKTTPYKDEDAKTEDRSAPAEVRSVVDALANNDADDLPF